MSGRRRRDMISAPLRGAGSLWLWTGWTQAILGWALNSLAELALPGYAEWKAQ